MTRSFSLALCSFFAITSCALHAQVATPTPRPPLGGTPTPKPEQVVQVFFEEQCRGKSVSLKIPTDLASNEALEAAGILRDSITSLRIPPGVSVTIYDADRFGGRSETFTGRTGSLGALNKAASSLKVFPTPAKADKK